MIRDPQTGRLVNVPTPGGVLEPATDEAQAGTVQAFYDFSTLLGIVAMLADLFRKGE